MAVPPGHSDTNLFIRSIPEWVTDDQLEEELSVFGPLESKKVMRDIHTGRSMEKAFARFSDADAAREAMRSILEDGLFGVRPRVEWALRRYDKTITAAERQQRMKLFIRNIPLQVPREEIRALAEQYGKVDHIRIRGDTQGGGFLNAFIRYTQEGCAAEACDRLHQTVPFPQYGRTPVLTTLAESRRERWSRRDPWKEVLALHPDRVGKEVDHGPAVEEYVSHASTPLSSVALCGGDYWCYPPCGPPPLAVPFRPLEKSIPLPYTPPIKLKKEEDGERQSMGSEEVSLSYSYPPATSVHRGMVLPPPALPQGSNGEGVYVPYAPYAGKLVVPTASAASVASFSPPVQRPPSHASPFPSHAPLGMPPLTTSMPHWGAPPPAFPLPYPFASCATAGQREPSAMGMASVQSTLGYAVPNPCAVAATPSLLPFLQGC